MPIDVPVEEWEGLDCMDWKVAEILILLLRRPMVSSIVEDSGIKVRPTKMRCGHLTRRLRRHSEAMSMGLVRTLDACVIKLEPQDRETAIRSLHRDDNNRFNPEGEGCCSYVG